MDPGSEEVLHDPDDSGPAARFRGWWASLSTPGRLATVALAAVAIVSLVNVVGWSRGGETSVTPTTVCADPGQGGVNRQAACSLGGTESFRTNTSAPAPTNTSAPASTTATTLRPKSGDACSTEGATVSRATTSESGPYENLGLRCSKAVWSWVVKPRGSCGDTRFPNAVLADGTAVSCVNEQYFAAGETLTDFFSGTYTVGTGTGQVPPGTYVVLDVRNCYWERVDRNGRTIENDFVTGAPRVVVVIGRNDAGFTNDRCGHWMRVG